MPSVRTSMNSWFHAGLLADRRVDLGPNGLRRRRCSDNRRRRRRSSSRAAADRGCRARVAGRSDRCPRDIDRERLVHHRHQRRVEAIGRAEAPARSEAARAAFRNSCGVADGDQRRRQRRCRRLASSLDRELRAERADRRKLRRGGHRAHARQRGQPLRQPIEERAGRFAGVALARQRQPHRQHAARLEAAIDALDVDEAPHQQPGAEQQHDRQRELGNDQRVTKTSRRRAIRRCARRP